MGGGASKNNVESGKAEPYKEKIAAGTKDKMDSQGVVTILRKLRKNIPIDLEGDFADKNFVDWYDSVGADGSRSTQSGGEQRPLHAGVQQA